MVIQSLHEPAVPVIPGAPALRVLVDAPMSNYTTWRIGGLADFLVRAATPEDVIAAVRWAHDQQLPVTTIGGGSNLLVGDTGIRGLVLVVKTPGERAEQMVELTDEGGESVQLRVGAQAPLNWTARYCCEHGWSGMAWGVGLPGVIGGATVNNAGAHDAEMKDHLVSVTLLERSGEIVERDGAWLDSSYRRTSIKDQPQPRSTVALAATLRLPKGDEAQLVGEAQQFAAYRRASQPTGKCAGSTFTNPPGQFAGKLLEEAGMKGFAVGDVHFSTKHSNFIVNAGHATAAQVRELIATGQARVLQHAGVRLETEIEEIGEK